MIESIDHVNIQTRQLDTMIAWYTDVLGLRNGPRPDFAFRGAWLYVGDHPIVHLVEMADAPRGGGALALEHAAFRASDLPSFLEKLTASGTDYKIGGADFLSVVQVNVWDPDGNHLHVDFPKEEAAGIDVMAPTARAEPD